MTSSIIMPSPDGIIWGLEEGLREDAEKLMG